MQTSLEHIFGSRTRVKLLRLFTANTAEAFFVRELSRTIREHMNSVRRELGILEGIGIVVAETRERKKYYRANPASVLFPELRSLFVKADLLLEQDFAEKIRRTGSIRLILLTGFFVGAGEESPTDLFIVGHVQRRKFIRVVNTFSHFFDRQIRYTVMTRKEFAYRYQVTDRFLYQILESKTIILHNQLHTPIPL